MKTALEKHLFLSDFQIPEQDNIAIQAILNFIPDLKPDVIHFVGDILDLTKQSTFAQNPFDKHTLNDEVRIAREILGNFTKVARKANKKCQFNFYSGNHEERLLNSVARKAPDLVDLLNDDNEYVLSLPALLQLKKLGIKWIPYYKHHAEKGDVIVEHGDVARSKAGYTAHAMLDKRGANGVSGHTHRLALIYRTQGNKERFWIENGSLCKRNFKNPYLKLPDWITGFSVGIVHKGVMHPTIIPIINNEFFYGGRRYTS